MVLVDTSIWIEHFRNGHPTLEKLLFDTQVICHSFVIGELACGYLQNRLEILSLLHSLPMAPPVEHHEILCFIETQQLMGIGLGLIDIHLLASARLAHIPILTADKKLFRVLESLGMVAS